MTKDVQIQFTANDDITGSQPQGSGSGGFKPQGGGSTGFKPEIGKKEGGGETRPKNKSPAPTL